VYHLPHGICPSIVLGLTVVWSWAALAWAEDPTPESERQSAGRAEERAYHGVTLRGGRPPKQKKRLPSGLQYLTWPGFRADEGRSEIFLQFTGPVKYAASAGQGNEAVVVDQVRSYLRNTFRPVNTSHFPGPVSGFRLRALRGNRIRLEIALRRPAKASAMWVEVRSLSSGGYYYLLLSYTAERSDKPK
jgi:hypothetical protein